MALSEKHKRFADQYLLLQNATQAYKAVYGTKSDNTAAVNGNALLRNTKVKEYISQRQEKLSNKLQITQEMVLEGYRKLAFYDVRKFFEEDGNLIDVIKLDDETAFALSGIDVTEEKTMNVITGYTKKIKLSDRRSALDSICKVLGFNAAEKRELSGKDGKPLVFLSAEKLTDEQVEKFLQSDASTDDESIWPANGRFYGFGV